jgi:protein-S-isoprenylcysteine O-methyltransferase Ste14
LAFFWIAPAMVAGWVPYALTRWERHPPLLGVASGRIVGMILAAGGLLVLLESFARFAIKGRGTPAPIAPTTSLVVSGLYCYVRNPMYLGVLVIIVGQALSFGSVTLLQYAGALWLLFHAFVVGYEERALRRQFGRAYETYRANVRRWWPRLTPWQPSAVSPAQEVEPSPSQGEPLRLGDGSGG